MRCWVRVVLTILLLLSAAWFGAGQTQASDGPPPPLAAGLPLTLSPQSGPANTAVTISGSGAPPLTEVVILWQRWFFGTDCRSNRLDNRFLALVRSDAQGRFTATMPVSPVGAMPAIPVDPTDRGLVFSAIPAEQWAGTPPFIERSACFAVDPLPDVGYFPQSGHFVAHGFLAYWARFGGLPVFGYPITDELQENGLTVQYFERARFEWHPGAAPQRYDVLLGRLGVDAVARLDWLSSPLFQPAAPLHRADCVFVRETQHNLCAGFLAYWQAFGALPNFGDPISEEFLDPENGLTVQYFERARFEWHPGIWPERFDVELGRLGAELRAGGQACSTCHITALDTGKTFSMVLTSRFSLILAPQYHPLDELRIICTVPGVLGGISNVPAVPRPFAVVRYTTVKPGECTLTDRDFHVTIRSTPLPYSNVQNG